MNPKGLEALPKGSIVTFLARHGSYMGNLMLVSQCRRPSLASLFTISWLSWPSQACRLIDLKTEIKNKAKLAMLYIIQNIKNTFQCCMAKQIAIVQDV